MAKKSEVLSFNDILQDLRSGNSQPLYVLEGDEEFLKTKVINALEKFLINPTTKALDMVVYNFDGKFTSDSSMRVINELKSPPFLSIRKLIVLKRTGLFSSSRTSKARQSNNEDSDTEETVETDEPNVIDKSDGKAAMVFKIMDSVTESSCLVFIEDKVDKRQKQLIEKIHSLGVLGSINQPDPQTIRLWVRKEFAAAQIVILPETIDEFTDRNDGNMLQMSNEIQKLILHAKAANRNSISESDLNEIGITDLKGSIFDLVDSISTGNASRAFTVLETLIFQKQPVPLIFFMIARQIRQLICACDIANASIIQKRMKVMPFVANKLYHQSRKMDISRLERLYTLCHDSDLAIKTSKISDRIALDLLITEATQT